MKITEEKVIRNILIAFWAGVILDAVAYIQMAFPRWSAQLMNGTYPVDDAYVFAMRMGAGLMLAWTILLVWGTRKPLERKDLLPITTIVIIYNFYTLTMSVMDGVLRLGSIMPQFVLMGCLFFWYCFTYYQALKLEKREA